MSKFTVYANGRSVAGIATNHMAAWTEPDICKLPDGKPKPFPNFVKTALLKAGATVRTKILGKPIWTKKGEVGPPSDPGHAGVGGGVSSGTYRAEAKPTTASDNVIVEGAGVVRLDDLTTQNHGNCHGIVDDADNLAKRLEEFEKTVAQEGEPPPAAGGPPPAPPGPVKPPVGGDGTGEGQKPQQLPPKPPEPGKCKLVAAKVACAHDSMGKKRYANAQGLLEVVPAKVGDVLELEAEVEGACAATHTKWTITGWLSETKVGPKQTFRALSGDVATGALAGIMPFLALYRILPKSYAIAVEAETGQRPSFTVRAYPQGDIAVTLDFTKLAQLLSVALDILKTITGEKDGWNWEFVKGKGAITGGWKEHSDHRAFFGFEVTLGFNPLIGGFFKIPIRIGPVGALQTAIAKLHIGKLDPYIKIGGGINVNLLFGRTEPDRYWTKNVKASGEVKFEAGIEAEIFDEVVEATLFASTSMEGEAKLSLEGDPELELKVTLGGLKGTLQVKTTKFWLKWIEVSRTVTFIDPKVIYEDKRPLFKE